MNRDITIISAIFIIIWLGIIVAAAFHINSILDPGATATPTVIVTPVPPQVTSIQWAGHTWTVTDYNDGVFTSDNVWVDPEGKLHTRLIYDDGKWQNFNLIMEDPVGYGTFKWRQDTDIDYIQDTQDGGNPYLDYGQFIFDNSLDNNQWRAGEVDIKHCMWGNPDLQSNCDWTIHSGDHVEYTHIAGPNNDYTLEWQPDYIKIRVEGPQQPYMEYTFNDSSKIPPVTGSMHFIVRTGELLNATVPGNLDHYETEIVMSDFQYIPEPTPTPTVSPDQPVTSIQWAGHTWTVTDYNGGVFTSRNVWVDAQGRLHTRLIYSNGKWHSFNLIMQDPVGYGTFKWKQDTNIDYIQDTQDGGNPQMDYGQFLFDNSLDPHMSGGEIDVEHCKWGDPNSANNCDWTTHTNGYNQNSRHITGANNYYTMEWKSSYVKFTVQGPDQQYMEYVLTDTSKIPPVTGQMHFIIYTGTGPKLPASPPRNNLDYYEAEIIMSNLKIIPAS